MSILKANTITNNSGGTPTIPGIIDVDSPAIAKAWCRFSSTLGILSSYNVASITENNTGRWRVDFTTPFTDANYVALSNASGSTSTSTDTWINAYSFNPGSCIFAIQDSSSAFVNRGIVSVAFFR